MRKQVKTKESITLITYVENLIKKEKEKPNVLRSSWKKYEKVTNLIKEFSESKKIKLNFNSIDWQFRDDLLKWLNSPPHDYSINNVHKIFQTLKYFMKLAHMDGLHDNLIFEEPNFCVNRVKVRPNIRLTPEEVDAIINIDFSHDEYLDRVRDMFVAICFSGIRIGDWKNINKKNIIINEDMEFLELMGYKKRGSNVIPIMQELRAVLVKYDYHLPVIPPHIFNNSLKQILEIAIPDSTFQHNVFEGGMIKSENVPKWQFASSHTAMCTFASNRYMEGWSFHKIMKILGYSEKQTIEYIGDISDWELSLRDAKIVKWIETANMLERLSIE